MSKSEKSKKQAATCQNCFHHEVASLEHFDLEYCKRGNSRDFCDKGSCEQYTLPF